jgi:hypothetical protein
MLNQIDTQQNMQIENLKLGCEISVTERVISVTEEEILKQRISSIQTRCKKIDEML